MAEDLDISNPDRLIMGDVLRLAFFAARCHPDAKVRTEILTACDTALDVAGAPRRTEGDLRKALASATGPAIGPMVATDLDIAITSRIWRACASVGKSDLFVGSADAIGEGYGALLGVGPEATYKPRASRIMFEKFRRSEINRVVGVKKDLPSINLGLLPHPRAVKQQHVNLVVNLKVDPKMGITVAVEGIKAGRGAFSADIHSWISGRHGDRRDTQKLNSLHALGISVNVEKDGSIAIIPRTPEATIRFASACASRNLLCLHFDDDLYASNDSYLVLLAPSDTAPCGLPANVHSRSGTLSDWLRIPPLRLVPELSQDVRSAIALWLRESVRKPIGDAV